MSACAKKRRHCECLREEAKAMMSACAKQKGF